MADIFNLQTVNAFPTTKGNNVNYLITENSLTRLINRLIDVDGFIITDGLSDKNNPVIGNGGIHLSINQDLKLTDDKDIIFRGDMLEFIIRGYYFSVPLEDLKNKILATASSYTTTMALYARIFIDNTDPDYPELVGQTAYEDGEEGTEEGTNYSVQFILCPLGQKPIPNHVSIPTDPITQEIDGLGTTYLYYDVMLLKYAKNDEILSDGLYLPFESLCKFDTHSNSLIDGGELKFRASS